MSPQSGILPRLRSTARELRSTARELLEAQREEMKRPRRVAAFAVRVVVSSVKKLSRDRASQMAAALSFQTLFSLLPLLVVALIILPSVRGLEGSAEQLRNLVVEFLVPESLVEPDRDTVGPPDPRRPATIREFNDARQVLRERIDEVLEALSRVSFAGIGAAGLLLFLYGATALVRTVEASFNLLYQADPPRPWSRLPLYFTLLTLGPVAVVAAHVLQNRLLEGLESWVGGWIVAPLAYVAPLAVTILLLAVLFRTIPYTWVSWRSAMLGALASGAAWFAFQEIFGLYVNRAFLTNLYGALALLPLFLLWIYWSWLIILTGLTLSFTLQYLAADEVWSRRPYLPGDPRWLVPITVRIAEAFDRGETVSVARLSTELQLPPRILRPYVKLLESRRLVRRLSERGGQHTLTLARPLASIGVKEILELAPTPLRSYLESDLLRELRRCELEVAGDQTLEQLIQRRGSPKKTGGEPEPPGEDATES